MNRLITFLIEDNPTVLENLVETLQEVAGINITAHSATQQDAVDWLQQHPGAWDLAIVDLFLKEGSGLGVLSGCRNRRPEQRVVVLSNYVTPDIRTRCQALGADAVFDKSRDLDAFIEYCNTDRPSGLAAL